MKILCGCGSLLSSSIQRSCLAVQNYFQATYEDLVWLINATFKQHKSASLAVHPYFQATCEGQVLTAAQSQQQLGRKLPLASKDKIVQGSICRAHASLQNSDCDKGDHIYKATQHNIISYRMLA